MKPFCGGKHGHCLLLRHTLLVLSRQEVAALHHRHALHGILLDEALLCEVAEILVEEYMYFLHRGVSVALLHPMVQHRFQVCRCNVPHDFLPDEREYLVLSCAFQPVVGGALHRGELENLEPMGQAVLYSLLRFIRITHLCIELSDVGGDFLLCLSLGFAGEHLAAFDALLVKVPDDALPSTVCPLEHIAVGGEPFLWHGAASFLNHQQYS